MGQGWANEEETTFLQRYMPKYELCQVKRNYQTFWPGLFAAYQAKFPLIEKLWPNQSKTLEALTDEENESYNKKLKAKHEVQLPFAREIDVALTSLESLKEWFRWRANPRSRNTATAVTKKDLKNIYQPNRTRGHKSYEIFAKLFRDTVDPIVEEACRVQGITGKGKLPVWHKVASGLWRNASQEQIDAVNTQIEAARDKGDDEETDEEPTPETYQHYLKSLPGVLTATVDPAVRKAGVIAICTFIGPVPDAGGQIIATTLQFGDSEGTPLFSSVWPGHEEVYIEHLGRFVRKYEFPEELCARRSLHAGEEEQKVDGGSDEETNPSSSVIRTTPNESSSLPQKNPTVQPSSSVQNTGPLQSPPNPSTQPLSSPLTLPGQPAQPTPALIPQQPLTYPVQEIAPQVLSNGEHALPQLAPVPPLVPPSTNTAPSPLPGPHEPNGVLGDASGAVLTPSHLGTFAPPAPSQFERVLPPSTLPSTAPPAFQATLSDPSKVYNSPGLFSPTQFGSYTAQVAPLNNPHHYHHSPEAPAPSPPQADAAMYGPYSLTQDVYSSSGLYHDRNTEEDLVQDLASWEMPGMTWQDVLNNASLEDIKLSSYNTMGGGNWCDIGAFNDIAQQNEQPQQHTFDLNRPMQTFPYSNSRTALPPPPINSVQPTSDELPQTTGANPINGFPLSNSHASLPPQQASIEHPQTTGTNTINPANPTQVLPVSSDAGDPVGDKSPAASQMGDPKTGPTPFMLSMTSGFGSTLFGQAPPGPRTGEINPPSKGKKTTKRPQASWFSNANKENVAPARTSATTGHPPPSTAPTPHPPGLRAPATATPAPHPPAPGAPATAPPALPPPGLGAPTPSLPESNHEQDLPVHENDAVRRSARGSVKNTWIERQNLIGSNTTPLSASVTGVGSPPDEDVAPPPWFEDALNYLQVDELGELWKDAVGDWVALETLLGYGKVAKTPLPVHDRPEEWSKWAAKSKRGMRPYGDTPRIDQPAEFGLMILKWWYNIQPSFRASNNDFPNPVFTDPTYKGDPWTLIRKSGPNGFVVLMTLMSWWGRSLSSQSAFVQDSRPAWNLLLNNIRLCLVEMVKPVPKVSRKRGLDETIEGPEESSSKRQKS